MYVPEHFREDRPETWQMLVDSHPLALLIGTTSDGLTANHIPLRGQLMGPEGGTLHGHIARANGLWRQLSNDAAVLVVFGGANAYVSPNWYPSKREHGKAVPTWNYATVHIHGVIRFIEDVDWLRRLVSELTDAHEQAQPHPWRVDDAPADYMSAMLRSIVGLEIRVQRVIGKFKGSQNRSKEDRMGVGRALRAAGRTDAELDELVPGARTLPEF